jgi:hypothetical protein
MELDRNRCVSVLTLGVAMVILAGCSGDVVGTVFVKMQSGDIKRGADLEVVLVEASSQFETEWKKTVAAYNAADEAVKDQNAEAKAINDEAFRVYLADIRNTSKEATYNAASAKLLEIARYLDQAHYAQRQHALELIQWGKKGTTRTSVDGRFGFTGVRTGKYYVYARYQDANNVVEWMAPVEVARGTKTVDLSNSNAGQLLR